MRRLLFLVIIISLVSCQNKKAHLVDLEKGYKDSAQNYYDLARLSLEDDANSSPHKTELERMKTHDTSGALSKEAMAKYENLIRKSSHFKVLADSIEWELKKY